MTRRRAPLIAVALLLVSHAALAQQRGSGDFYELGDYDLFPESQQPPRLAQPPAATGPAPKSSPQSAERASSTIPVRADPASGAPPAAATGTGAVYEQGDLARARAEAKAMAAPARAEAAKLPIERGAAEIVPGYAGTKLPQTTYFDDPDALVARGTAASASDSHYRTVVDSGRTAVTIGSGELARATAVERDPDAFLDGENLESDTGACRPLPPSAAGDGWYEATCNTGLKVERADLSCRVPLVVGVERGPDRYQYVCEDLFDRFRVNGPRLCLPFQASVEAGTCREVARRQVGETCLQGTPRNCTEPGEPIHAVTLQCDAPVTARTYTLVPGSRLVSERRDEGLCQATTAGMTCENVAETCVDAEPQTRDVNGLAVTRACWAWQRTLACHRTSPATDCGDLEANARCRLDRETCLDDPQTGACKVRERVYRCPLPGGGIGGGPEYICGDDVYCINGECEPIVREASTEFMDALVGLHTMGQAKAEFDEATLTLFSGTRETCHRKLFGLANCCSGKGVPIVTPALCSAAEKQLDHKDEKGLCLKVGSFCSDEVLGVCVTKKDAYCCFESKLSRILQEQGRAQLGKPWDRPKREQCRGFSVAEFAQLDLSRMDFREVYAEFIDAAKLPDEVATARTIQERIEAYYRAHGRP